MSDYIELKPVMDFIDINIALAKKQVEENKTSTDFWQGYYTTKEEIYRAMKAFLETEPKSDIVPMRHAYWIMHDDEILGLTCECSDCHAEMCGDTLFCPSCGAKMDGKKK